MREEPTTNEPPESRWPVRSVSLIWPPASGCDSDAKLLVRVFVRRRGVLVRMSAVFVGRNGVFSGLFVTAMVVMVRSHSVVVGGSLVMRSRVVVVLAGRVLGFRHDLLFLVLVPGARGPLYITRKPKCGRPHVAA